MLRKKLKLADSSEQEAEANTAHPPEFSLSTFINEPKVKLPTTFSPVPPTLTSPHSAINTAAVAHPYHLIPPTDVLPIVSVVQPQESVPLWSRVYQLEQELCQALLQIPLPSDVAATYNPIEYAAELHLAYMQRFLTGHKPVLFLGMNPGPWGMCQTGVPFGYVPAVRDWMQLRGEVLKPIGELAVRPVDGLQCTRGEQSGQRWWGLYQELCETPENFFRNCFVFNICPLAFFHSSGRNITPAEFKGTAKSRVQDVGSEYLLRALHLFGPTVIVSIGRYCEDRVKVLVRQNLLDQTRVKLLCMPHPSPRSLNNTNWAEKARQWLVDNGVMPYLMP